MSLRDLSDEELVDHARRAGEGDARAFEELVRRHQRRVLTNCRHLTREESAAPDLAQEVFVKAYFAIESFEHRSRFGTWIQRIKVNHCLNHLRKRRVEDLDIHDETFACEPELRVDPLVGEEIHVLRRRVSTILDRMPETLRVPLVLCDYDGLAYEEVAEQLGIGLSATKMRIKRARERFREEFEAQV